MVDSHERERLLLVDEVEQVKRERELLDRGLVNKDSEILDLHSQLETATSATRTADNRLRLLDSQVPITRQRLTGSRRRPSDGSAVAPSPQSPINPIPSLTYTGTAGRENGKLGSSCG